MTARASWIQIASSLLRDAGAGLRVERDVPLGGRTYLGVGGPAALFVVPEKPEPLAAALARLTAAGVPFDYLGAGSNLLVADSGPSFVVIAAEALAAEPEIAGETVRVGAGYHLPRLVQRLQKAGLAGLEFAEGIPGSVGGSIRMNAGWHEGEIGKRVASVVTVTPRGAIEELQADQEMFAYRSSPGLRGRFIAAATLKLESDDPKAISARMRGYRDHRVKSQPTGARNAGCIFKNPPGEYAGRLIEECGLKGRAVGGAAVSEIHANFVINRGDATFSDVATLIDTIRAEVLARTGIELETEVRRWT
jgi:UDP-N-acetylmuramate dehydrogenase